MASTMSRSILSRLYQNDKGKLSFSTIGMNALTGYFGIQSYNESRENGNGVIRSALAAGADTIASAMLNPVVYGLVSAAPSIGAGIVNGYDALSAYSRQLQKQRRNVPFANATFVDSQQTYTMRQAGMNLARQGQMASRQTSMGNEAASVSYMGR